MNKTDKADSRYDSETGRKLSMGERYADAISQPVTDSRTVASKRKQKSTANARVTQFVNADNKLCFCVSVVNEGFTPHADEGRVLGHYNNAKDAQFRASIYNNEGI